MNVCSYDMLHRQEMRGWGGTLYVSTNITANVRQAWLHECAVKYDADKSEIKL
jgi:hypothetical protein